MTNIRDILSPEELEELQALSSLLSDWSKELDTKDIYRYKLVYRGWEMLFYMSRADRGGLE